MPGFQTGRRRSFSSHFCSSARRSYSFLARQLRRARWPTSAAPPTSSARRWRKSCASPSRPNARSRSPPIEAAAPSTIAETIPEPEHPHLPAPVSEQIIQPELSSSYDHEPLIDSPTESISTHVDSIAIPEDIAAPLPIAVSGELSILPPSTGLPVANGSAAPQHAPPRSCALYSSWRTLRTPGKPGQTINPDDHPARTAEPCQTPPRQPHPPALSR